MKTNNKKTFISIEAVKKSFGQGESKTLVLQGVNLEIKKGEICLILGASGSGKSTLLNLIGGLDRVDSGKISVDGLEISRLNMKKLSVYRRQYLGFIFQLYNLIPNLTVKENIKVCEYLTNEPLELKKIIENLSLEDQVDKFPSMLSGGQQQRCSIGRAIIKNPKLLLCDEPTGALDYHTSKEILALLEKINKKFGTTILLVTHNQSLQAMANRVITIKDGIILKNIERTDITPAMDLEW